MGDERGDDADQRRADVYSSARIGAAAALTLVLVVLLVLDVAVPDYDNAKGVHTGRAMFAKAAEVTTNRPAPDPTPAYLEVRPPVRRSPPGARRRAA